MLLREFHPETVAQLREIPSYKMSTVNLNNFDAINFNNLCVGHAK